MYCNAFTSKFRKSGKGRKYPKTQLKTNLSAILGFTKFILLGDKFLMHSSIEVTLFYDQNIQKQGNKNSIVEYMGRGQPVKQH